MNILTNSFGYDKEIKKKFTAPQSVGTPKNDGRQFITACHPLSLFSVTQAPFSFY
jgi:hypothetical protein